MTRRLNRLLAATAMVALLAGCGSGGTGSGSESETGEASPSSSLSGEITVLAAASLTDSFQTLGKQFEQDHPGTTVTFSFGASSALATQISSGAPADVFASASTKNMDSVVSAGDAADPKIFAKNEMEIAVPAGNPAGVKELTDLTKPTVKVALCQPEVPCGATAAKVFTNAGITVKPVTEEPDVKATLAKVSIGEVDAAVVYVTDVKAAGDQVEGVTIPSDVNASTDYPIATLKESKNPEVAQAFMDYVSSDDGLKVLADAGFASP